MWSLDTLQLCAAIITALVISYISMPVIIKVDNMKRLLDKPDQIRKFHKGIIPTLGGIGIFGAFLISFSLWGKANNLESYPFFVASLLMLFLIGLKDDTLMLSPIKKLMIQTLAAVVVVGGGNIQIGNLGGLFGLYQIPIWLSMGLSVLFIVTLINAFNLIDGIDGLAGGVGIICASTLGIWFWNTQHIHLSIMSFVLVGSLFGFLIFNFSPAKIFMGDTGSMIVGFIIAYLSLHFIGSNTDIPITGRILTTKPIIALSILIIPIFDTMRIFVVRIMKKTSPFRADYNHIHHVLLRNGYTHSSASVALWAVNILIITVAFAFREIEINMLLLLVGLMALSILPVLIRCSKLYHLIPADNAQKRSPKRVYQDVEFTRPDSFTAIKRGEIKNEKMANYDDN